MINNHFISNFGLTVRNERKQNFENRTALEFVVTNTWSLTRRRQ